MRRGNEKDSKYNNSNISFYSNKRMLLHLWRENDKETR